MTDERVRRRPRRAPTGVAQSPWRALRNPYRPVEILSADEVETIHRASLRILDEIGVEVLGDRAIDLFRADGARVDPETRRVRVDPARVEELVALAPSEFTLHARNSERDVIFGGANVVFCAVGGPAFVSDLDRGRRAGNERDFVDYVRLIGALDVIHQEGGGPLEPTDLPVETRHLDMYRTFATELDKTWQCLGFGATPVEDALRILEIVRGVDRDTLLREPSAMTVIREGSRRRSSRVTRRIRQATSRASSTGRAPKPRHCQVLSSSTAKVRYMSRWRVSTGRSLGSSGPPPSWWMTSRAPMSRT